MIWWNKEVQTDGKHVGISWNKMWFLSSLQSVDLFHITVFGNCPTKQLASMGIPAPLSYRPLPLFSISLPLWLTAAGPRGKAAKFIFSLVVPLGWRQGPLPRCSWCIRWGPLKKCRWDSSIPALYLIVLAKGYLILSYMHGQCEVYNSLKSLNDW